jgi:hypothetical protein
MAEPSVSIIDSRIYYMTILWNQWTAQTQTLHFNLSKFADGTLCCCERTGVSNYGCSMFNWISILKVRCGLSIWQFGRFRRLVWAMHYSALLVRSALHDPSCSAVLQCPALSCIVLHCPALPCFVMHCPALSCIVLHCTALSCIALIALSCFVLHCPALSCIIQHVLHCPARPLDSTV